MLRRAIVAALLFSVAAVGVVHAEGVRVGSEAEVTSDDGLNLRTSPDYGARVIETVKGGRIVFVVDGPKAGDDGSWYQVEFDGAVGWVLGGYLGPARPRELSSRGTRRDEETVRTSAPAVTGPVKVGAEAEVNTSDGINLRSSPDTTGKVVTIIHQSKYVYVMEGPEVGSEGPWYKVDYDGDFGWVLGTFLAPAKPRVAPSVARRPAAGSAPRAAPVVPPARVVQGAPLGGQIAFRAQQLVGSRYAFGGTNPSSGFDCSGLVSYVMGTFGVYPGRTSWDQAGAGYSVKSADLQPGDIVVFANTYAGGYDHTGIYIGGGRFVHAEDWDTGVIVSSVFGGYYGRHYAGARRPY